VLNKEETLNLISSKSSLEEILFARQISATHHTVFSLTLTLSYQSSISPLSIRRVTRFFGQKPTNKANQIPNHPPLSACITKKITISTCGATKTLFPSGNPPSTRAKSYLGVQGDMLPPRQSDIRHSLDLNSFRLFEPRIDREFGLQFESLTSHEASHQGASVATMWSYATQVRLSHEILSEQAL
jgi:hypothetical protein